VASQPRVRLHDIIRTEMTIRALTAGYAYPPSHTVTSCVTDRPLSTDYNQLAEDTEHIDRMISFAEAAAQAKPGKGGLYLPPPSD
jgi:hypothetical protein